MKKRQIRLAILSIICAFVLLFSLSALADDETDSNILNGEGTEVVEPQPEPKVTKVKISWNLPNVIEQGEKITIHSSVDGECLDQLELVYRWEVDRHDGAGFVTLEEGHSTHYSFKASKETLSYDYRLTVLSKIVG